MTFKTLKKYQAIWIKSLNIIMSKINITKSSMIQMKPNDDVELSIVNLDEHETYPEECTTCRWFIHISV